MKSLSAQVLLPIISVLICGSVFSCKKSDKHTTVTPTTPVISLADSAHLGFNWTGNRIVGDTLTFTSNASSVTTWAWDFGDGSTAATATPGHVYTAAGTYTVTLVLNSDAAFTASKTIKIFTDPVYTASMGGVRLWRHSLALRDTTYHYPDTSFALDIIDPLTISVAGKLFNFSNSDSSSLLFYNGPSTLYYFKSSNSLLIIISNGQISWPSNEYFQTP